jgi:protease I
MLSDLRFAVLVGENTNPVEYHYARLRLKEAGARVTVIGLDRTDYRLEDQSLACADATIDQVAGQPFDGVVIPGGLGPEKLRQDARIIDLVKDCYARGKLCAAICHGQQVLISAGLMRGVRATAGWSMQDDLRMVGAIVPPDARAVRDGQIVTAIFPQDSPAFFRLILAALAELTGRPLPQGYPNRLAGQTWGIVVDDASDHAQVRYLQLRVQEEGGKAWLLGRRAGQEIRFSSPAWEWGELGWRGRIDAALPNPGVIASCDTEAELDSLAVSATQLDGLLLPGGLATWMIRAHPGLRQLIQDMHAAHKPIGAVERGPKLLFMTGVLDGRTITCAPQMRDDVLNAVAPVEYRDAPAVRDGNLLTAQGTEDLPLFMQTLLAAYGNCGEPT